MPEIVKRVWSDPVWSKVIATLIIAAAAAAGSYFLDWWPTIGGALTEAYRFLQASTTLPNWALILGGISSLPSVLLVGALLRHWLWDSDSQSPSWQSYVSDIYFDLRWRWKYLDDGNIYDVHTFCPHCDYQVFAGHVSPYRMIDHIGFKCDSCGRKLAEFQDSYESLENKTKRFIQQKLRNGTWQG